MNIGSITHKETEFPLRPHKIALGAVLVNEKYSTLILLTSDGFSSARPSKHLQVKTGSIMYVDTRSYVFVLCECGLRAHLKRIDVTFLIFCQQRCKGPVEDLGCSDHFCFNSDTSFFDRFLPLTIRPPFGFQNAPI